MSDVWIVVLVVGAFTMVFKAAGPVFLGRRRLPAKAQSVVDLVAPVMLTALVVTQTVGGDEELVVDARIPGVAAAAIAIWRGAPIVAAMFVAAAVTALVRAVAVLELTRPPPEDGGSANRLGDEAEHRDHEKPHPKVPHAIEDRTPTARP